MRTAEASVWSYIQEMKYRVHSVWWAFGGRPSINARAGDYDAAVRLSTAAQGHLTSHRLPDWR